MKKKKEDGNAPREGPRYTYEIARAREAARGGKEGIFFGQRGEFVLDPRGRREGTSRRSEKESCWKEPDQSRAAKGKKKPNPGKGRGTSRRPWRGGKKGSASLLLKKKRKRGPPSNHQDEERDRPLEEIRVKVP